MTILLNVFTLHPIYAEHPGRHIAVRDAVPVLSSLDQSHGLTVDQVEGIRRLLSNWDRIVHEAATAKTIRQRASEQLSLVEEVALEIEYLETKRRFLEAQLDKFEDGRREIWAGGYGKTMSYADQVQEELTRMTMHTDRQKQRSLRLQRMAPLRKQQLQEAEDSLERAGQEWHDLKVLLSEVNSTLSQVTDPVTSSSSS